MTSIPSPRLQATLADRYRIERELGLGGMALVFLARDLRHDRWVALKVLRPELAAVIGAERFLEEIRTTANLQHPHILPLHDSGEADGTVFYVMPFVEGETLRDRMARERQLPVQVAVRIAREIAAALDYAHRRGVVHRDIKPENILLHEGQALVADFGISLAVTRSEGGARLTETGLALGTPQYMAPEQAMGERDLTPRVDIFALGCVLYEMLTGEPPFTGATAQSIVARAMTEPPRPIIAQRHTVPPHVEAAALRALEVLPADRFATAAEFAAALGDPPPGTASAATRVAPPERVHWRLQLLLAGLLMAGAAALGIWAVGGRAPSAAVARYPLALPVDGQMAPDFPIAIAPDGSAIAYFGRDSSGSLQVWVKRRDREAPEPVHGTNNSLSFDFSPDSRALACVGVFGELRTVPLAGGSALLLASGADPERGVAWLDDGTIAYVDSSASAILRVPAGGGAADTVVAAGTLAERRQLSFPVSLPGGRGLLFSSCRGGAGCPRGIELQVVDLATGEERVVARGGLRGQYAANGAIVYADGGGALHAVRFDARALRTRGEPIALADSVAIVRTGFPLFVLAPAGTRVTRRVSDFSRSRHELVWVTRSGTEEVADPSFRFRPTEWGGNVGWALSPDGARVAIGMNSATGDNIWVKQLPRGPASRLTLDALPAFRPRWSRDGRWIYYHSLREDGLVSYFRVLAQGTGAPERVLLAPARPGIFEAAWASDGRTLVLRAGGVLALAGGRDLFIATPASDSTIRPLLASPEFDAAAIAISPNGRWLLYESNETGRVEVFLRPFPDVNDGKWQVSAEGGRAPLWSRDGREIFFVNAARAMVAVPFAATETPPHLGARTTLFTLRPELYLAPQENYTAFDIAPDGRRFLMARVIESDLGRAWPLVVTVHWLLELDERLRQ